MIIYLFGFTNFFIWEFQSIVGVLLKKDPIGKIEYDLSRNYGTFWLISGIVTLVYFFQFYVLGYLKLVGVI